MCGDGERFRYGIENHNDNDKHLVTARKTDRKPRNEALPSDWVPPLNWALVTENLTRIIRKIGDVFVGNVLWDELLSIYTIKTCSFRHSCQNRSPRHSLSLTLRVQVLLTEWRKLDAGSSSHLGTIRCNTFSTSSPVCYFYRWPSCFRRRWPVSDLRTKHTEYPNTSAK